MILNIVSFAVGHSYSFFEEMSVQVLCLFFKIGLFVFLFLSCNGPLYVLDARPLSNTWFADIFLHFCRLSFHFLDNILWCTDILNFDDVIYLLLWLFLLVSNSKLWGFNTMFSWSFMILVLTLKSLIHFEPIFIWCEGGVQLHTFARESPIVSPLFIE